MIAYQRQLHTRTAVPVGDPYGPSYPARYKGRPYLPSGPTGPVVNRYLPGGPTSPIMDHSTIQLYYSTLLFKIIVTCRQLIHKL